MTMRPTMHELISLRHTAQSLPSRTSRLAVHGTSVAGAFLSAFRGQGMEFEEVREYAAGDDIRHVDWRVTARTGRPHLKVYREERARQVLIAVDNGASMQFGTRVRFKSVQAARAAAFVGWCAELGHDAVGGVVAEGERLRFYPPQTGRQSLWALLQGLMESTSGGQGAPSSMTRVLMKLQKSASQGAAIFVISDFNSFERDEGFASTLGQLSQKHEVALISIHDPGDYYVPDIGRVGLMGMNGREVLVDTSASGTATYRQQWLQRQAKLEQLCHGYGVRLLSLGTADEVSEVLVREMKQGRHHG